MAMHSGVSGAVKHEASIIPSRTEIYRAVGGRTRAVIAEQEPSLQQICRDLLAGDRHVLSECPATLWPVVVIRSCVSARGDWSRALWPAAALEIAMTAADVFDDLADGEETPVIAQFGPGPVLTAAAGLLSLAGSVILRACEDGCPESVALQLGRMLGDALATAADGQLHSLSRRATITDVVDAYRLTAGKSGPLGELAARLGSAVALVDADVLDLYGTFGWHFAVAGQLINDALDASPGRSSAKRDVQDGSPTVPLVFAGSNGAPRGASQAAIAAWEDAERRRIAEEGGIILTEVLAIADRLRAEQALAALDELGHETSALRELLGGTDHGADRPPGDVTSAEQTPGNQKPYV